MDLVANHSRRTWALTSTAKLSSHPIIVSHSSMADTMPGHLPMATKSTMPV
jgi:hypothetical protein